MSRLFYAAGRVGELVRTDEPAPPERASERLGQPTEVRPQGRLLWLHTTRPGDTGVVYAIAQTLSELRDEEFRVLVTTKLAGKPVEIESMELLHQLVPGDTAGSVARFLDHWAPDAAIIVGPPDRPLLLTEVHKRRCPLFLAATRRGDSAPGGRLGLLPASLIANFDLCLAPSAAEAEELRKHTEDDRVIVTGPLADTGLALPCDTALSDEMASQLGGRPVWLADMSTENDLQMLAKAHRRAIRASHRLLLIVSPADAAQGGAIAAWFEANSWRTAKRSDGDPLREDVQVYIADLPGEMGLWYRLAPTTFLGGTFYAGRRTSDPFAPAALGSAVIHGPETASSPSRFARLRAAGATRLIDTPDDLGETVYALLSPDKAAALAHAGWLSTTESAHAVEMLAARIDEALEQQEASSASS